MSYWETEMRDEILDELWAVRDALAAESKNDIHEIARHFMRGIPDPRLRLNKDHPVLECPAVIELTTTTDDRPLPVR